MPDPGFTKKQKAFLGYRVTGYQPFSFKSQEKTVVCGTTLEYRVFEIFVGLLLVSPILFQFAIKPENWDAKPLLVKLLLSFFMAAGFPAIYAGLFMKRELIFNGTDLSIEFYRNKKLSSKIARDQIQSFEITTEPRRGRGLITWTAHIFWVLLANGKRQPLLESWKEGPINEVGEWVKLLFKVDRPVNSGSGIP